MKGAFVGVLGGLQGLGWDEAREKPVDRLTALAAIQNATANRSLNTAHLCSVGKDLVAFKYSHRVASRAAAEEGLVLCLVDKRNRGQLQLSDTDIQRIASWAIHEWAVDVCNSCKGAREVPAAPEIEGVQPMKPCVTCHGTGRRRYEDHERITAMGQTFDRAMYEAHSLIAQAEALAIDLGKRMVGRW
jgi:hypothetical protein